LLSVDCEGDADYTTIGAALDDAHSGYAISVAPCTYRGSLNFKGKAVDLYSTRGPDVTTIEADPGRAVIEADDGEGAATTITGFTLTGGGDDALAVPAIDDEFSSLTIRDAIITGNVGSSTVYTRSGRLVLDRVRIFGNTTTEGIVIRSRRGMIALDATEVRCDGQIGYSAEHGGGFIDHSTFDCPAGVAISAYHGPVRLQRSRVDGLFSVENEGSGREGSTVEGSVLLGGASVVDGDLVLRNVVALDGVSVKGGSLTVMASIITGASCGIEADKTSTIGATYTDFWDDDRPTCGAPSPVGKDGNIAADPKLAADQHLDGGSACIDAGPTEAGFADPDGSPNDLGAWGGPLSIGGGW
jgi:hypothetical protein